AGPSASGSKPTCARRGRAGSSTALPISAERSAGPATCLWASASSSADARSGNRGYSTAVAPADVSDLWLGQCQRGGSLHGLVVHRAKPAEQQVRARLRDHDRTVETAGALDRVIGTLGDL